MVVVKLTKAGRVLALKLALGAEKELPVGAKEIVDEIRGFEVDSGWSTYEITDLNYIRGSEKALGWLISKGYVEVEEEDV